MPKKLRVAHRSDITGHKPFFVDVMSMEQADLIIGSTQKYDSFLLDGLMIYRQSHSVLEMFDEQKGGVVGYK